MCNRAQKMINANQQRGFRTPLDSNLKSAIPARPNPSLDRRKLDRPRLRMQEIFVLHRPAMGAVIRKVPVLGSDCRAEEPPPIQRRCQCAVHE